MEACDSVDPWALTVTVRGADPRVTVAVVLTDLLCPFCTKPARKFEKSCPTMSRNLSAPSSLISFLSSHVKRQPPSKRIEIQRCTQNVTLYSFHLVQNSHQACTFHLDVLSVVSVNHILRTFQLMDMSHDVVRWSHQRVCTQHLTVTQTVRNIELRLYLQPNISTSPTLQHNVSTSYFVTKDAIFSYNNEHLTSISCAIKMSPTFHLPYRH
ncbi:hypothetical protein J6590_096426 [Homalodisca vitripennis]|nr:hypothetical protein J6590_096426 [Homalodisca vitripennis]